MSNHDKATPTTESPITVMDNARRAVREHLAAVAQEILDWQSTGTLSDGKLREIADPLRSAFPYDHIAIAQKLAIDAALEAVSVRRT